MNTSIKKHHNSNKYTTKITNTDFKHKESQCNHKPQKLKSIQNYAIKYIKTLLMTNLNNSFYDINQFRKT